MEYKHTPVMLKEAMGYLAIKPGNNYIDCTLGGGGYTAALAKKVLPEGKILAIDLDEMAINNFKFKILNLKLSNIILAHGNFKNLSEMVKEYFTADAKFDGIVFDLGLSGAQLEDRSRGFSFNLTGAPLGMNFGEEIGERAENIINSLEAEELAKIFRDYGEEKFAYKIALAIAAERRSARITATDQLVKIITGAIPKRFLRGKIHPATKVFQSLRLAVNRELPNLREALPQAVSLLKSGGKLVVISYHSLEDRIVKQYFKEEAKDCLCPPARPVCQCGHKALIKILTRKVLRSTGEEVLNNPRARSAKLRAAEKI